MATVLLSAFISQTFHWMIARRGESRLDLGVKSGSSKVGGVGLRHGKLATSSHSKGKAGKIMREQGTVEYIVHLVATTTI
jgi:hypothetical protein